MSPAPNTKERILDAAERLFAEQGPDATSLRQITAEAGVNVAAIHYHFGPKEQVLAAVVARRLGPLNQDRLKRLDQVLAAAGDRAPRVEDVLRAFLAPALEAQDALAKEGRRILARLIGRIYIDSSDSLKRVLLEQFGPIFSRFAQVLVRAIPELPPAEVVLRMQYVAGALQQALADLPDLDELSPVPLPSDDDDETTIRRLVTFVAAGLRAPLSPPSGGAP